MRGDNGIWQRRRVDKGGVKKMINGLMVSEINRLFTIEEYNKFRKAWCKACVMANKHSKNRELLEEIKKQEKEGEHGKKNGN